MIQLLMICVSYAVLLFLLMPVSASDFYSTAVMLAVGVILMCKKRIHKVISWQNIRFFHVLVAVFVAVNSGLTFYHRWAASSKLRLLAGMIHMRGDTLALVATIVLSILSMLFLCAVQQIIRVLLNKSGFERNLTSCVIAAAVTAVLAQVMIGAEAFSMGSLKFTWCTVIVAASILFLYCLLGRIMPSILIGSGIFMVVSTVNTYIYSFRGRLFEPVDFLSVGTAMNVAENYSLFPIPLRLLLAWGIFAAMLIDFYRLQRGSKPDLTGKRRLAMFAACALSAVAVFLYASGLKTYHWDTEGARFNGYILDFVSKVKEISVPEPENYSTELIDELADQYGTEDSGLESEQKNLPHIIVIMDEAFSDLRVNGDFATNTEVMPFISSLEKNTVSGYVLTSVYGGNTANSEYEFLTGNSLAWLSPNVVPYQQYIRSSTYSMISYLKSAYHYKCLAMHPFSSSGWNRPAAYDLLGFDDCYFFEAFPHKNYVRQFISDQEMFEFLIEQYEEQKDERLFIFGVTMQNHGDYTYEGENYTKSISLNDYDGVFPEAEQYLSLIHETDRAVEYLITYFENEEEEVVIVFFGDHQPRMKASFYNTIGEGTANGLNERQKRYEVPFFIWANYDIEGDQIDCISLNYLSSYVYRAAGIALPPYNRFLQELEKTIPAINANGYYSPAAKSYLSFDEADEEERYWLGLYEALQYNGIFDKNHLNEVFFPPLPQ